MTGALDFESEADGWASRRGASDFESEAEGGAGVGTSAARVTGMFVWEEIKISGLLMLGNQLILRQIFYFSVVIYQDAG
jgi:hypothetical protein